MKKTKSQRILLVLELEQRKEKASMDKLSQARTYLDHQKDQLSSLRTYHSQYLQSLKASMQGVANMSQLHSYQGFIAQVSKAIEQQSLVVDHAQVQFDHAKDEWLGFREKCKGLADLISRYQVQERTVMEKQTERRLEDDFLARRSRSK